MRGLLGLVSAGSVRPLSTNDRLDLGDRLLAVRDRLLRDPRFLRWAVRLPFTRIVARRQARALFDLCAGFVYSQVLRACVDLRLFEHLADGPQSLDTLARRLSLPGDAARTLLEAATALGLVEGRRGDRYGLGSLGAALLGNPGALAMIAHHSLLYADLADPVALLRGESRSHRLADYWAYAGRDGPAALDPADVAPYSALMSASQAMIAAQVLDAYPFRRHRCLLDVGGGEGAFLIAAARRVPGLDLMLFDLPAVADRARRRIAESGLEGRAKAYGGDFHKDALPMGADIATLVRVIHDHDDAEALAILRAVRRALPAGGTLLLAEPMAGTRGAEPIGHAYFGFYLLAMGRGRPRRGAELTALLRAAGFGKIRAYPTAMPMLTGVLVAEAVP